MNNTIPNVPRELLERVLNAGWGSETVNALDDLRDFLESASSPANHVEDVRALLSAPSPAGVDGLEVVANEFPEINYSNYGQDEVVALQDWGFTAVEAIGNAQRIIDGLRGENHQLQRELNLRQSQIESSGRIAERAQRLAVQLRTERDQQAQRIGELKGLLREVHGWIDESARVYRHNSTSVMLYRIDAALSAGKEGE